jgi:hypothetical protein
MLDNRWVVPYNPYLIRTFNCHINVEACSSIKSVKYLFKYIYKGHDRASVAVRENGKKYANGNVDEITDYKEARWVGPSEAMWRIYGFDLHQCQPPVLALQCHLPGQHMVSFHAWDKVERVLKKPRNEDSMLTEWFTYNQHHPEARGILYHDFPKYFTWNVKDNCWQPRKNSAYQAGRLVSANPAEGDRYFLWVLLNHVTGATSWRHLRTVNGVHYHSFRVAACAAGLIEDDNTLDNCLTECAMFRMPSSLHRLFATILVFCEPKNVDRLWTKHFDIIAEDFKHNNPNPHWVAQMVLIHIRSMLQSLKSKDHDKAINKFPLRKIDDAIDDVIAVPREIFEEVSIKTNPEDVGLSSLLNEEQRATYDEIMSTIDFKRGGLFFVDGPGGTGKTFLYRALLGIVRNQNKLAIATATSSVAAIMPGGRTAHSRFKIPLTLDDKQGCGFTKQCGTAKLLQQASLIIWDEAPMTKRQAVEALDYSMRDIMGQKDLPFGGKTDVFGGDFRQVPPVVRKGSRAQIVDASLRKSYLWEFMRHLKLVHNMRAETDPWFADYMLRIGNGTEEVNEDGDVRLPDEICVSYTGDFEKDLDTLIESIFPNLNENMANKDYNTSRAILSIRND